MIISLLLAQEPEPKKKRKETKEIEPTVVVDTTTVSVSERAVKDSIALEQRVMLKELEERIEKVKTKK